MPLPEQVCGTSGVVVVPLPAAGPWPAVPPVVPAAAVGAEPALPDALVPAAPLDDGAVTPAAAPAVPVLVGGLPGFVVVAPDPPAGGFAAVLPAVALAPAELVPGVVGVVAVVPLAPVAPVCESAGGVVQAARHSESNAEGTSILRAKVTWLIIDILLSSRVRDPNTDESRIGAIRGSEQRNTISIDAP